MRNKEKVIPLLKNVLEALENNSIKYDRTCFAASPMGVISQTMTLQTYELLYRYFNTYPSTYFHGGWRRWVLKYWPIGGQPYSYVKLFVKLYEFGFDRSDIIEFEGLSNKEVLNALPKVETDILEDVVKTRMVPKIKELFYFEEQYRKDWWGKLWGLKGTVKVTVPTEDGFIEEKYTVQEKIGTELLPPKLDADKKGDFIIYLKKYIEIYG